MNDPALANLPVLSQAASFSRAWHRLSGGKFPALSHRFYMIPLLRLGSTSDITVIVIRGVYVLIKPQRIITNDLYD